MIVEGETGSVVPAGDYTALRDTLRTYFENPALASQQGWSGREHVRVAFAIEKEANSLAEIYENLLET
jgi:mannosyltransferase